MHVLPQLRKVEEKHGGELVVVGVHSGKFLAERQTENIRQAVVRLGIEHPVVNDRYFRIWRAYDVNAWPTLILIDPEGRFVSAHPGEITFEALDPSIQRLVDEYQARGLLDRTPLPLRLERSRQPATPLAFPGKLTVDAGHLFVADSNHNRIVVMALEGDGRQVKLAAVIGRGSAGLDDGDYATASFNNPQGLAVMGDVLFVADTGNHAIRAIDLRKNLVMTIAGTGEQARYFGSGGPATRVALSSPWDVFVAGNNLYIAMAGSHQLWKLDLIAREIQPHVGSGFEELTDGPSRSAGLAQPSGITSDGRKLFFADSEASAIRWADLAPGGEVHTIVGTGLFDFGDRDGVGREVRLQHPLGVAWHEGRLYVADTYNNKVKLVDPANHRSTTIFGTGAAGLVDGDEPQFDEPGGICAFDGLLYIADTNNHAIRVADLQTGRVETVSTAGLRV